MFQTWQVLRLSSNLSGRKLRQLLHAFIRINALCRTKESFFLLGLFSNEGKSCTYFSSFLPPNWLAWHWGDIWCSLILWLPARCSYLLEFDDDEEDGALPQRNVPFHNVVGLPDGHRQWLVLYVTNQPTHEKMRRNSACTVNKSSSGATSTLSLPFLPSTS